jgi:hypothetical protein
MSIRRPSIPAQNVDLLYHIRATLGAGIHEIEQL